MDQRIVIIQTGIEEIDCQHQQLVKCLNDLKCFAGGTYGFAASFTALNTLMDYVRFHFGFEEKLLVEWQYPYLKEHMAEHKAIAEDVQRLWDEIEAGDSIEEKLVLTIRKWILDHINAEDIQYANFIDSVSRIKDKLCTGS